MKFPLIITLIVASFSAFSQEAILTLKDSTVQQVFIQANSATELYTKTGSIAYTQIISAQFKVKPAYDLQERLSKKGIKIFVGDVNFKQEIAVSPMLAPQEIEMVKLANFKKFTNQRDTGKVFQLIGVAGLTAATYLQIKYTNDALDNYNSTTPDPNFKQKKVPTFLPLAALGIMGVGIIIDMDASKHLRKF